MTPNKAPSKGGTPYSMSYAEGGSVLGRTRDFVKEEPDQFRGVKHSRIPGTVMGPTVTHDDEQNYPKHAGKNGNHRDKSLKTVKPRH